MESFGDNSDKAEKVVSLGINHLESNSRSEEDDIIVEILEERDIKTTLPKKSLHEMQFSNTQLDVSSLERPLLSFYPRKSLSIKSNSNSRPLVNFVSDSSRTSLLKSMMSLKNRDIVEDAGRRESLAILEDGLKKSNISLRRKYSVNVKSEEVLARKNSIEAPQFKSVLSLRRVSTAKHIIEENQVANHSTVDIPGYNEYLMQQYRHSTNYIQQMNSDDLIWEVKPLSVKMIGPHLKGGKIGKGAFGKVKEGLCIETLQRVAIKIISKKRVKKMADNIIIEIKLLRRLKHINIVTLVDVFAKVEDKQGRPGVFPWFETIEQEPLIWMFEDGTEEERYCKILKWYIILEFCPCSLQTILDHAPNNKIPIADTHEYFVQLINGIEYLHSQNVIHIKPGNILLTVDGIVKITDFGIAEQFDIYAGQDLYCDSYAGTHQFVAPEVIREEYDVGFDVDIYACGVVLYYMLSGKLPFDYDEDANVLVLQEKIMKGDFTIPAEADELCRDLLAKILNKNPDERWTTTQILKHTWVLSYYPGFEYTGIDTYRNFETDIESTTDDDKAGVTTMIPFISKIYLNELEEGLKYSGYIHKLANEETDESPKKIIGWIKRIKSGK